MNYLAEFLTHVSCKSEDVSEEARILDERERKTYCSEPEHQTNPFGWKTFIQI